MKSNDKSVATVGDVKRIVKETALDIVETILAGMNTILKDYATKKDLESLATKRDLARVEQKVDAIEEKVHKIDGDVSDTRRRVIDLEADSVSQRDFDKFKATLKKN